MLALRDLIPNLAGVWWLIRRRKKVPQVSEV